MRVLRICSVYEAPAAALADGGERLDPVGGMQTHTAALTRALDRRGVAQTVLTAARRRAPRLELVGERSRVVRLGIPIQRARQLYSLPAAVRAQQLAREADVVHVHLGEDVAVLPLGYAAARCRRLPLVVTVHSSVRHTLVAVDARTRLLIRLGGPIEEWVSRRADAVIALTDRLARLLADGGVDPRRVTVIPSGVERTLFAGPHDDPFSEVRGRRVVFVGRLSRQKGLDTLVEAAARLETPDASVLVVGDGPDREHLMRLVTQLNLDGRVRLLGFLPHERVPAVLAHADVLVLPSVYEELGSVLVEAMHSGVPIVASRVGGIPDAVGEEAALLVPPGDPDALAGAVDRVLAESALAKRLTDAGRRRAERYDWDHLADRVRVVYEAVARGAR